jgi:hypothetical protein
MSLLSLSCRRAVGLGLALVLVAAGESRAADGDGAGGGTSLALGAGLMRGTTSYRLGSGTSGRPLIRDLATYLSELKFPLDTALVALRAETRPAVGRGRLTLTGQLARSARRQAGDLVDRDWGYFASRFPQEQRFAPGTLDIYSVSPVGLDAWQVELGGWWRLGEGPGWYVGAGGSLLWRSLSYSARDLTQTYPSWEAYFRRRGPVDQVAGTVLTYQAQYLMPCLDAVVGLRSTRRFGLEARLGLAPWLRARDRDEHLERALSFRGESAGPGLRLAVTGRWTLTPRLYAELSASYLTAATRGRQEQERLAATAEGPAGHLGTIDQVMRLDEGVAWAAAGWTF